MNKQVTLGQLLGIATTVILAILGNWLLYTTKVTELNVKYDKLSADHYDLMIRFERYKDKRDDEIRNIFISLEKKEDRK